MYFKRSLLSSAAAICTVVALSGFAFAGALEVGDQEQQHDHPLGRSLESNESDKVVEEDSEEAWEDFHEAGRDFQGDIIAEYEDIAEWFGTDVADIALQKGEVRRRANNSEGRRDLALMRYKWWSHRGADGKVEIPYKFDSSFAEGKDAVEQALNNLAIITGVFNFVPWSGQQDHIVIESVGTTCRSYYGKIGWAQPLGLGRGCLAQGIIQHEFMHALGMFHEMARSDRDEYVEILSENIRDGYLHNFAKRDKSVQMSLGSPYDFASLMHYPRWLWSKNGQDTMRTKPPGTLIGNYLTASEQDVVQLRLLYQCESGPRNYSDYMEEMCSRDCKCWEGEYGCNGDDQACQGSLVCTNNQCVSSTSPSEACPSTTKQRRLSGPVVENKSGSHRGLSKATPINDDEGATSTQTLPVVGRRNLAVTLNRYRGFDFWFARNSDGVVEVPILASERFSTTDIESLWESLEDLHRRNGVLKFVPWTTQHNYIRILFFSPQPRRCRSNDGLNYRDRVTNIDFSQECINSKATVHRHFLHALGFMFEHERTDRDLYIRFEEENLLHRDYVMRRYGIDWVETLESPYDYNSVMHVDPYWYSSNGKRTIETIPSGIPFGQATEANDNDILQLRLMYQCLMGPRTRSEYEAEPCTQDCKCWMGAYGCNGNDYACQGNLICHENQCIDPCSNAAPDKNSSSAPLLAACDSNKECRSGMCTGRLVGKKKCRFCARKKEICETTENCCDGGTKRVCHPDKKICVKCRKGADGLCI